MIYHIYSAIKDESGAEAERNSFYSLFLSMIDHSIKIDYIERNIATQINDPAFHAALNSVKEILAGSEFFYPLAFEWLRWTLRFIDLGDEIWGVITGWKTVVALHTTVKAYSAGLSIQWSVKAGAAASVPSSAALVMSFKVAAVVAAAHGVFDAIDSWFLLEEWEEQQVLSSVLFNVSRERWEDHEASALSSWNSNSLSIEYLQDYHIAALLAVTISYNDIFKGLEYVDSGNGLNDLIMWINEKVNPIVDTAAYRIWAEDKEEQYSGVLDDIALTYQTERANTLSDNYIISETEQEESNARPIAVISASSPSVDIGNTVVFDATNSYDVDGDDISFGWALYIPNGSSTNIVNVSGGKISITPDVEGTYRVSVTVSDDASFAHKSKSIVANGVYPDINVIYENDDQHIYIENLYFDSDECQFKILDSVTVPNGERWTRIGFAASQDDVVLLADDDETPSLSGSGCPNYVQAFDSDREFDFNVNNGVRDWSGNWTPGDKIRFAVFSYFGDISGYGINAEVHVTTDVDGDGVPDEDEDAVCLDNPNDAFDSDGDGTCDNADKFDNDPSAWIDDDDDLCPDIINGVSPTGLILDQFLNNSSLCIDVDADGHDDREDDKFPDEPLEWSDSDSDLTGDNTDKFVNDPSAAVDGDNDGCPDTWNFGKSAADSTSNPALKLDLFPLDISECEDTDGDGVGDNSDWAPSDPSEWQDSDGDGVGDNSDPAPNDSDRSTNEAPVFGELLPIQVKPGDSISVEILVNDDDGDSVTIGIVSSPDFVELTGSDLNISPPNDADLGSVEVLLFARDGFGGLSITTIQVEITDHGPTTANLSVSVTGSGQVTSDVGGISCQESAGICEQTFDIDTINPAIKNI